jgi:hypothetical protein
MADVGCDLCVFAPLREPSPEEESPFLAKAQMRKGGHLFLKDH